MSQYWNRWSLASLATLLYWLSTQALRPFLVLRLDELGATTGQVALVVSAYGVFALAAAIPAGRLIDRVGVRTVLLASLAIMGAVGPAYPVATTVSQFFVLEAVSGLSTVAVWIGLQTFITNAGSATSAPIRPQLALFSFAWGAGLAAGPSVGGVVYDRVGFIVLCISYAATAAVSFAAVALLPSSGSRVPSSKTPDLLSTQMRSMLTRAPVLSVLLSSFVTIYVASIRTSFYPLYLRDRGVTVSQIGMLLTVLGVSSLIVRAALVPLTRRWRAGPVLVASTALAVIGMGGTPWWSSLPLLAVAASLVGIGLGLNSPITVELMAAHTAAHERGVAMALRTMANRLALVVQPLAFGGFAAVLGLGSAFLASGALLAGLTAGIWRTSRFIDEKPQERPLIEQLSEPT